MFIKVAEPFVGEEEAQAVREVLLSGSYVSGAKVQEFEQKFADYIGVKYAIAVNSGTAALHISLAALGIGPGDEVIVPPLTFFSTVTSVFHQNAIPIFADIELDSYCLSPQDVEQAVSERTRAVIPVHYFGNAADMEGINRVAQKHHLKVIEDCAQAHGTELNGSKVGSIGDTGAFSFFATKHMTTGEGGMITTNDKAIADLARIIRNHGMSGRDDHVVLGYNYRMTEMAAAMGIVQLNKLDDLNFKRIENSLYLINELKKRQLDWLILPGLREDVKHTFFWCPILIDEEKLGMSTQELIVKLRENGVETRHRYKEPLYKQKLMVDKSPYPRGFPFNSKHYDKEVDYGSLYLPNVEKIAGKVIGLPNHPKLGKEELDKVIAVIQAIRG
ncbi:DegT/DnrJ/EryC1/StrS family aminotransferase [Chloroflexota bacterium]